VLEAGHFAAVTLDPASGAVELTLEPRDGHTPAARLVVEGAHRPTAALAFERGAYTIPLSDGATRIALASAS